MKVIQDRSDIIEVYAEEGKLLDLGDGELTTYVCLPPKYDISKIKEVD